MYVMHVIITVNYTTPCMHHMIHACNDEVLHVCVSLAHWSENVCSASIFFQALELRCVSELRNLITGCADHLSFCSESPSPQ